MPGTNKRPPVNGPDVSPIQHSPNVDTQVNPRLES